MDERGERESEGTDEREKGRVREKIREGNGRVKEQTRERKGEGEDEREKERVREKMRERKGE